jgi:folate-binding protein YgfZ
VGAVEALRIEAGWPEYGRDIGEDNFPQEVGRDQQAISFTKGCYVGQETVARIASHGHVNQTLVGLRFATSQAVPPGEQLISAGQPAGHVTSATFSPRYQSALALGYVRRAFNQPGSRLESSKGEVEVVELPHGGD